MFPPPASGQAIITTVAGTGAGGDTGDGGPATAAKLGGDQAIVFDAQGNYYEVGYGDCSVREINTAGIIETVAGKWNGSQASSCKYAGDGGPATSASLDGATGLAVDSSGNLYIADTLNCIVRMVTKSTGIITTIAGTVPSAPTGSTHCGYSGDGGPATSAELDSPAALALDPFGNILIADELNCRIRKIDTNGMISTVMGTGTCGYAGNGGPATSAEFNDPFDIKLDGNGNIYIADETNCVIRKVNVQGTISTVAGNHTCAYAGVPGPATSAELNNVRKVGIDLYGNLYLNSFNRTAGPCSMLEVVNGNISAVAGGNGCSYSGDGGPATSADLNLPWEPAFDFYNNLYIADRNNDRIRKVAQGCTETSTQTTMTLSTNPSLSGQTVTLTATVTPPPTAATGLGSVTFYANGAVLGSHGLLTNYNGVVGITYSGFTAGTYYISALYNPPVGGTLCASRSNFPLRELTTVATVTQATSSTGLTGASSSTYGQAVMLTATVTSDNGNPPTGAVTFKNGSTTLGSANLSKTGTDTATATLTTSALPAGTNAVTAEYEGSSVLSGSTSMPISISVAQATSTISLTTASNPIVYGQAVTITATVSPQFGGEAGGSVTFTKNGAAYTTVKVNSGNTASFSASGLGVGTFTIGATFNGDSNVSGSTAAMISQTVNKDNSSTVTTSSASGTTVTITSKVTTTSPGTAAPTGTAVFYKLASSSTTCTGGTELGSANLSGGMATLKVTLAAGTYNLCSVYGGSGYVTGSSSPTETQTVN